MPPTAYVRAPMLSYWRDALCVGQSDLAARAGTSPATIRRLERGGQATSDVIQRLTRALEDDQAEIVAWCEDPLETAQTIDLARPLNAKQRHWLLVVGDSLEHQRLLVEQMDAVRRTGH